MGAAGLARHSRNRIEQNLNPYQLYAKRGEEAASPSLNLRKLVAEGTVGAHLNTVLRLVVGGSLLLVSVRNDHELDRFLLEKQKQKPSAKKRKRGSADDPICHRFGDFGPENLCRFHKTNPCPRCKRHDDSK